MFLVDPMKGVDAGEAMSNFHSKPIWITSRFNLDLWNENMADSISIYLFEAGP